MSLPDGFLDELRTRISIAQVVGRKVTWDNRKSNPAKGDMWAPCPFHSEKTASFHVDDQKGFYYCFGCHAKGDALSFVRETENASFIEAVEILASEAGMQMPQQDPRAAQRAEARKGLAEVMEAAVAWTRLQLATGAARDARAYLEGRGLTEATLKRFEIGFAPDSRTAMTAALKDKGIPEADIVAAGLAIKPDDGGPAFDRFRHRIMFPIRDARGRAIAFGGRAMSPDARAKYLNSPETPLFDKGRALYNIAQARSAGRDARLVLAEGYMDVIALAEAGFPAVAPLGTAVTEDQLALVWRLSPEPVVALDGDIAGLRAAHRLIDLALPLLEPGRALRFCLLPQGLDPDDLIRRQGPEAMRDALDQALPMVELLWRRETDGKTFDSPERRAALDSRLRDLVGLIRDTDLRTHYRDALRERRATLFGTNRPQWTGPAGGFAPGKPFRRGVPPPARPAATTLATPLASGTDTVSAFRIRESAILYACLCHPQVLAEVEAELDEVRFHCDDLETLRRTILQVAASTIHPASMDEARSGIRQGVISVLGEDPAPALVRIGQVRDNRYLGEEAGHGAALLAVREELAKHRAISGAEAEVREAEDEIAGFADEGLTWRLAQANEVRDESLRARAGSPGGDEEDTAALSRRLQAMIDGQIWRRDRR